MTNMNPAHMHALALSPTQHSSLDAYIQAMHRIPMLTAEEEHALALDYHENGNLDAARQMVLAHLRFVVHIAKSYNGYGLAQSDLIQEGNIGLMKAVKRFDPHQGVRLISFAVHWIKSEIHDFVIRNWRIVKVATTKAQRKLFFNLRRNKSRLGWFNQKEVNAVAKALDVPAKEVLEMEKRLHAFDAVYDGPADDQDEDQFSYKPADILTAATADPADAVIDQAESTNQQQAFYQAFKKLDERSQDILTKRWLQDAKATLHDLADTYQISAERVRQLESQALKKLKSWMR